MRHVLALLTLSLATLAMTACLAESEPDDAVEETGDENVGQASQAFTCDTGGTYWCCGTVRSWTSGDCNYYIRGCKSLYNESDMCSVNWSCGGGELNYTDWYSCSANY